MFSEIKESKMGHFSSLRQSNFPKHSFVRSSSHESERTKTISTRPSLCSQSFESSGNNCSLPFEDLDDNATENDQTPPENDTTDVETIGVISISGSVIHYSLNSSAGNGKSHSQLQQIFTPTVVGDNGELTLKLLNVYLSLFITDANFAQSSEGCETVTKWSHKKLPPYALVNAIPDAIGSLVDVIGFVDQTIQTISSFLCNASFQDKCHRKVWANEELAGFQSQIVRVLKTLVLEYAPQTNSSPVCHQFNKALNALRRITSDTGYWKQTRRATASEEVGDDWILQKLQNLECVPLTIVESLKFDIIMPTMATPYANSRKSEIEILETFTTLYAILLMEIKKLFQSVVSISLVTGILPNLECSLLVGCLEGFLHNSFVTGSTELLVDLDKLVLIWTQAHISFRKQTENWAIRFIALWKPDRSEQDLNTMLGSTVNTDEVTSPEFDVVRLFINEVIDICALSTDRGTDILEAMTMKDKVPTSGLGWLTIFQDNDLNTGHLPSANTREIESFSGGETNGFQQLQALYGAEFSLIEEETTVNVLGESGHFWSRLHLHHESHQFRNWVRRGLRSTDVNQKHSLLDKCHKAKVKLRTLADKFSHRSKKKEAKVQPVAELRQKTTVAVISGPQTDSARPNEPKITLLNECSSSYRFEEAFDRTTFSGTFHDPPPPRRYENLRRRKDRFMFLFFGEEK
ncbi:LANO_0D09538g1_1 [Lachancea nothofagi CBS 11611]|uniref:LANO_0D09538g1_1 n=1 Tax=Lachancea nothofagi CBS 11611 TaxID=1266666 RepID=A0A1G4JJV0_9SACH|nr:LANO_0D09538g1_1 [Lachancea nothofagi CBS 11611]